MSKLIGKARLALEEQLANALAELAQVKLDLLNSDARVKRLHIIIANRYSGPAVLAASSSERDAKIAESMARRAALRAKLA